MQAPAHRTGVTTLVPYAAFSASYFTHVGFFNPYLTLWLKDIGLSLLAISVLTSIQAASRLYAPYGWGLLADKSGSRIRWIRFCSSIAFASSIGLWWQGGFAWLFVVLFVMFTNTSAVMPMCEATLSQAVTRDGVFDVKRYGRVRVWGSVGFLVAVFAAGAWFEHFGMAYFPAWATITIGLVMLSAYRLPDIKETAHSHLASASIWPIVRKPQVRWFFITLFFHVLSHIGIYVFFSLYCDYLGYSKIMIGALWAISVIVEIAWFFSQAYWLKRFNLTTWLLVCAVTMALRTLLTAGAAEVLWILLIAQALHAITFAAHHTVCIALMSDYFPGPLRGRGQALYTVIGYGLTGVLGALAGGYLSTHFGLRSIYWVSLGISLAASLSAWRLWFLHSRQPLSA